MQRPGQPRDDACKNCCFKLPGVEKRLWTRAGKAKNALRTCLQSRNCFVGAASPRRFLHFAGKNRLRASSTMHLFCLFCSSAFLCACLREVAHECSTSAGRFTPLTISYRRFAKRCKIRRCEKRRLGKTHQATLVTRTSIDFFHL